MPSEPFVEEFRARWPDMDFNQHMRNAAFLGCSEDTRLRFLDRNGFGMAELQKLHLGPVVLEDKLNYKKELRLLEAFRVDMMMDKVTRDARRMKVRNRFFRSSDSALAATVESVIVWFDLNERKIVAPPVEMRDVWLELARTDEFAWYE